MLALLSLVILILNVWLTFMTLRNELQWKYYPFRLDILKKWIFPCPISPVLGLVPDILFGSKNKHVSSVSLLALEDIFSPAGTSNNTIR